MDKEGLIEAVKKAIDEGAESITEISRKIQYERSAMSCYLREEGINVYRLVRDKKVQKIKASLADGVRSLEELCRKWPSTLLNLCKYEDIKLPDDLIPMRYRPEIDKLIDRGLSQKEIGRRIGVTGEAVHVYIKKSGQHITYLRRIKRRREFFDICSATVYNSISYSPRQKA